jgi:hypothetical protein
MEGLPFLFKLDANAAPFVWNPNLDRDDRGISGNVIGSISSINCSSA